MSDSRSGRPRRAHGVGGSNESIGCTRSAWAMSTTRGLGQLTPMPAPGYLRIHSFMTAGVISHRSMSYRSSLPRGKDDLYDIDRWEMTPAVINEWIRRYPGAGIGVSWPKPLVVDIAQADLVQPMLSLLPPTPCARRGRPERLSLIYRCDDPLSGPYPGLHVLGGREQWVTPPT